MEEKKQLDASIATELTNLITSLNEIGVKKEDIVTIFQNHSGQYVALYYQ